MTKKEFSAGGIVFRQQITDNKKQKKILWLVAQHSLHKGWVFPKGFIGDHVEGESKEDTAVREVREETGVEGKIIKPLPRPAAYFYVYNKEKRFKTVYYYLMEYRGGDITKHDFEMQAVEWWPEEKVRKDMTYKGDRTAFDEALILFKKLNKNQEQRTKN